MKALNKMLVAGLTTATLLTGSLTPALAAENSHPRAATITSQQPRRAFLQMQETISYNCGIYLNVKYTFNDGYGAISAINSITMTRCPSNISNVSWNYTRMDGGDSYLIIVHFTRNGTRYSETARLWA